ncbi:MAG: pcp 3 [Phycisphaerales bacterium]|nr:pcp 3 [Phycisphaerales bacterium]
MQYSENAAGARLRGQRITAGAAIHLWEKAAHGIARCTVETLESRVLISAAAHHAAGRLHSHTSQKPSPPGVSSWRAHPIAISHRLAASGAHALDGSAPQSGTTTPDQMRGAYGLGPYGASNIVFGGAQGDGAGQTIAIIGAYDDPNAFADLNTFSTVFGLPTFASAANPVAGKPTFSKVNQSGGSSLPAGDPSHGWDVEASLDIEWAHVMAPQANIMLVEATSSAWSDLVQGAVNWARGAPGVSVVSMSFGGAEFSFEGSSTWGYDKYFTTPANHNGVTFLAATGDNGPPGNYPAYSPNVVAVGGTSIHVNPDTGWSSESGWVSSGGGVSLFENQPAYQAGKVNGTSLSQRTIPDVSIEADPSTGVAICDSAAYGTTTPWLSGYIEGGTSLAAPMWAGLIAVADQGRVLAGQGTLDGPTQTLPALYKLPASDFHDITSDTANPVNALAAGYDLVTGLGSPAANKLIPDLAALPPTLKSLRVDDGAIQRSEIRSLTLTFDRVVSLSSHAITLARLNTGGSGLNDGSAPTDASVALGTPITADGGITWVVPILSATAFSDASGSLTDGIYAITVHSGLVSDPMSQYLAGGDQVKTFHRLFGDVNGSKAIDNADFTRFANAWGSVFGSANYNRYFDYAGLNGLIGNADFAQFSKRFGKVFTYINS